MRLTYKLSVLLASALLSAPLSSRADRFLLATFSNGEQKLRVFDSTNASSFDGHARGTVYTPPAGSNLRDPSLIKHAGRYYVCHTTGNFGQTNVFSIIVSDDLANWSHLTDVSMAAIGDVRWTWAPEWFLDDDGSLHVFVSASTTPEISNRHIIHELHPLNQELTQWSAPMPVTGDAFPAWTDSEPGRVGAIDAFVVKRGDAYYLFHFDSVTSCIEVARSTNTLTGPYSGYKSNNWQGIGLYKEGPSVMYLGGGRWRMIYADAIYSYLNYTDSTDNWATWTPPTRVTVPGSPTNFTINHGTLLLPPGGLELGTTLTTSAPEELQITFYPTSGDTYRLHTSTNLTTWIPGDLIHASTNSVLTQTFPTSGLDRQFWRIERLLP